MDATPGVDADIDYGIRQPVTDLQNRCDYTTLIRVNRPVTPVRRQAR